MPPQPPIRRVNEIAACSLVKSQNVLEISSSFGGPRAENAQGRPVLPTVIPPACLPFSRTLPLEVTAARTTRRPFSGGCWTARGPTSTGGSQVGGMKAYRWGLGESPHLRVF